MIVFSFWNSKGEGSETVAVPNQPDHLGTSTYQQMDAIFVVTKQRPRRKWKVFLNSADSTIDVGRTFRSDLGGSWTKKENPNIRNFHFLQLSVSFWSAFIVKLNHSWNTREINRIGWQVWPRIDALRTDTIQFRCAHTMHLTSSEKWQVKNS